MEFLIKSLSKQDTYLFPILFCFPSPFPYSLLLLFPLFLSPPLPYFSTACLQPSMLPVPLPAFPLPLSCLWIPSFFHYTRRMRKRKYIATWAKGREIVKCQGRSNNRQGRKQLGGHQRMKNVEGIIENGREEMKPKRGYKNAGKGKSTTGKGKRWTIGKNKTETERVQK